MGQIKIYALEYTISKHRDTISKSIHACSVDILGLPKEKKFHRFISLSAENFVYPDDRSENYIIVEVTMILGRTTETKKQYTNAISKGISEALEISQNDVEIVLIESAAENWHIRGKPADEFALNYKIKK